MPTEDPEDNKAYCKSYYQRLKSDPAKYAKRLAAIADARRRRRASGNPQVSKPVKQAINTVKHPSVSQAVSPPPKPAQKPLLRREDMRMLAQERAAIMEFDGGMSRPTAESAVVQSLVEEFGDTVLSINDLFLGMEDG
jgi:hypothetical protein